MTSRDQIIIHVLKPDADIGSDFAGSDQKWSIKMLIIFHKPRGVSPGFAACFLCGLYLEIE